MVEGSICARAGRLFLRMTFLTFFSAVTPVSLFVVVSAVEVSSPSVPCGAMGSGVAVSTSAMVYVVWWCHDRRLFRKALRLRNIYSNATAICGTKAAPPQPKREKSDKSFLLFMKFIEGWLRGIFKYVICSGCQELSNFHTLSSRGGESSPSPLISYQACFARKHPPATGAVLQRPTKTHLLPADLQHLTC